jgi:hypothetical protein
MIKTFQPFRNLLRLLRLHSDYPDYSERLRAFSIVKYISVRPSPSTVALCTEKFVRFSTASVYWQNYFMTIIFEYVHSDVTSHSAVEGREVSNVFIK